MSWNSQGAGFDEAADRPILTGVHRNFGTAEGYQKKSNKKYFTKTKEDEVKEPFLLDLKNQGSFISPWVYVGLENKDRVTFVKNYVLTYLETTIEELSAKNRNKKLILKKKIFLYAMREYCELKLEYAGSLIGTDHANTLHHVRDIKDKLYIKDEEITAIIADLDKVFKHEDI